MSYMIAKKGDIVVTWADGYLPPRNEFVRIVKNYPNKRPEFNPSQLRYEPEEDWPREKIFESAASMIISDFHNDSGIYRSPCSVWIARLYDENTPSTKNILGEIKGDSRCQDYRHIIGVHSVGEAEECMKHLLDSIGFNIKESDDYQNYKLFSEDRERIIYEILQVFISPHLVISNILGHHGYVTERYTR